MYALVGWAMPGFRVGWETLLGTGSDLGMGMHSRQGGGHTSNSSTCLYFGRRRKLICYRPMVSHAVGRCFSSPSKFHIVLDDRL